MKRVFLISGLSALIFLLAADFLPERAVPLLLCVVAAAGLVFAALRFAFRRTYMKKKSASYPGRLAVSEIILTAAISVCVCGTVFVYRLGEYNGVLKTYGGTESEATLRIEKEPEYDDGYWVYYAVPVSGPDTRGYSVKLRTEEKLDTEVYDYVSGTFVFNAPEEKEYYLLNRTENVVFYTYPRSALSVTANESKPFFGNLLVKLRAFISGALRKYTGRAYGFAKALLLGDKSSLSDGQYSLLKDAGLAHVAAVSGLHVGYAAAFMLAIFSFIKKRSLRYALTFPWLLLLAGAAGFSPSVLRAVFMICAGYAGALLMRKMDSLNVLCAVLTAFLAVSPFSARSLSLLLSFSAAAGLAVLARPLTVGITTLVFRFSGRVADGFLKTLISLFSVSLACTVFTVPVMAAVFGSMSFAGMAANILCLWAVKYIFILSALTVLLSPIGFLAPLFTAVSAVINWGVAYIMTVSEMFSGTFLANIKADPVLIILAAVFGYIVYIISGKKKKRGGKKNGSPVRILVSVLAAVAVLLSSSLFRQSAVPSDDKLHVVFCDVGQGDGAYVSINEKAVVFDCGGSKDAGSAVTERLRADGVTEIDYIVLSHLHDDHANGISELFDDWDIDEVIIPYTEGDASILVELSMLAAEEGAEITMLDEDAFRQFGDAKITILTEQLESEASDQNENSLVSEVTLVNFRVMFTGDITARAEKRLVDAYGGSLSSTVLCVPHHGSKYSSSEAFLEAVSPSLSVISVGKNSYGHPADEVVTRLLGYGDVLITQSAGYVEVVTDGVNTDVTTEN